MKDYAELITEDRNRHAKALEEQCQQLVEVAADREVLRSQVAELQTVLALVVDDERKFVEFYRTDADEGYAICNFCKSSHLDEYQIDHHPKCPIAQARAALARQEVTE